MSFILDALKKSETDRQRQSGPALFEVKVVPPKVGLPLWAVAIVVLLGVNLVIVAWVLLRRSGEQSALAAGAATATLAGNAGTPAAGPPAATLIGNATTPPAAGYTPAAPVPPSGAGQPGFSQPPATAQAQPLSAQGSQPAGPTPAGPSATGPMAAGLMPAGSTPAGSAAAGSLPAATDSGKFNPDDYAPATEPAFASGFGHVRHGTESGLPLYPDAAAVPGSGIPQLRLDLHVFAARPQDRFIMINMRKLREGDSLPEGIRVESITPEGAVLSHNGSRFLLPRD